MRWDPTGERLAVSFVGSNLIAIFQVSFVLHIHIDRCHLKTSETENKQILKNVYIKRKGLFISQTPICYFLDLGDANQHVSEPSWVRGWG